jgi:hypothetical protein
MATAKTTTPDTFTWPKPSKRLLSDYLKERVSDDASAPHEGLPFISDKDVLRVKPSDWVGWLAEQGIDLPKREALQALKDAGLVQKVYALPALDGYEAGKSFGLYAGPAPAGTARLPRRVTARKAADPAS